jgi:integrase
MKLSEAVTIFRAGESGPNDFKYWKSYIRSEFPNTVRALRLVDLEQSEPRSRKGYNLFRRESKRSASGFVYYVRYYHKGKMLSSKWNTHTSNFEEAEMFAAESRNRLVGGYLRKHGTGALKFLEEFYGEGSASFKSETARSGSLTERRQRNYELVIRNKFVPFLRERRISSFEEIDHYILGDFQDELLARGLKPQTVNDHLKPVNKIFAYLARKGKVKENPCKKVCGVPVREGDQEARGCYETDRLNGIFGRRWDDGKSYLLCLLIYTTGMRNSEIKKMKICDIVDISGHRFIDVKESKTASGVRLVPLHDFVYRQLLEYGRGMAEGGPLFGQTDTKDFRRANAELARRLGASEEIAGERITFYSGRHFWKTLMNSEELGEDVEEYFMGHKVSGDVKKRYNHRDKQGAALMVKKARQIFDILDRRLFSGGTP